MTDAEWLACDDPRPMLEFLRAGGESSRRKLRLFACACCRRVWHFLADERGRRMVEAAEQYADNCVTGEAFHSVTLDAVAAHGDVSSGPAPQQYATYATLNLHQDEYLPFAAVGAAFSFAEAPPGPGRDDPAVVLAIGKESRTQCGLIRCIVGNPFRPVVLHRGWLTPAVVSLAQAAYEERALPSGELEPARLAVLSDALEDAGCTDAALLTHLRSPGPHVRGCWVIELLLGKE